jgi:hypothetical protein
MLPPALQDMPEGEAELSRFCTLGRATSVSYTRVVT